MKKKLKPKAKSKKLFMVWIGHHMDDIVHFGKAYEIVSKRSYGPGQGYRVKFIGESAIVDYANLESFVGLEQYAKIRERAVIHQYLPIADTSSVQS